MKTALASRWTLLVIANVLVVGVLGFYSTLGAAPQAGQPPFANPVEGVSWRAGARILSRPATAPEAALQEAVEAVYSVTGSAAQALTDWFARGEAAYFSRATFEVEFFGRHGFREIDGIPVDHAVYDELLRSYDEGVAEFLALEHVKPNILGNTRMVLEL